jgi:hypothetical protein
MEGKGPLQDLPPSVNDKIWKVAMTFTVMVQQKKKTTNIYIMKHLSSYTYGKKL